MESWSLEEEVPSSPWSTMPSSRNRRLSMPAFLDPLDEDNITVELFNRFDPLQGRDECGEELLSHPAGSHPPPPGPGPSYASEPRAKPGGMLLVLRPERSPHPPNISAPDEQR
ncbi:hypothetical protein AAFF_G00439850 [Aldrovandia affinis]|uniref:Uncharacterized protein n=1 Tax=Aldrovandia affinis TaxID=143900 RepID=A0AAD7WHN8_9TELE|nr:hypothetical protein AAFF_G00439850 [Aldrovandia affinis]